MAIDAMKIGQERGRPIHVLCEKLMGWNISQCKKMIQTAEETGSILSIGHQRHYSMLYAHAIGDHEERRAGRRQAHPRPVAPQQHLAVHARRRSGKLVDGRRAAVLQATAGSRRSCAEDYDALKADVQKYGFDSVEQLVRWRLYNRRAAA